MISLVKVFKKKIVRMKRYAEKIYRLKKNNNMRLISKEDFGYFEGVELGSYRVINPDSIAKLAINQKLLPKWR